MIVSEKRVSVLRALVPSSAPRVLGHTHPHPRQSYFMAKQTYASRYTRVGTSAALIIPKAVREEMGLVDKDLVVMRVFGKLLIARRLTANDVVDISNLPTDAIPSAVRS